MPDPVRGLAATLIQRTSETATLQLDDGQTIQWPLSLLRPEAAVGDRVTLTCLSQPDIELERRRVAQEVLNELLNGT